MRDASRLSRPSDPVSPPAGLHALVLIRLADYAAARRLAGLGQADLLVLALAEQVAAAIPAADVTTVGRELVEARLTVDGPASLEVAAGRVRAACRRAGVPVVIGAACSDAGDELALIEAAEAELSGAPLVSVAPAPSIVDDLPAAIARGELFLQYQPKLHLRRQEIVSVEALIRWQHPRDGVILPGDFIPAAEASNAIEALTLWTLREVIADQRVLASHDQALPVFVNIAGSLLSNAGFVAQVIEMAIASGARLGFEITETCVINDPDLAIRHLQQLAAIGISIAIDDYGAGLSSLAYLKQLPARELKIDKLFVTQLSSSHRDPLIVRSTIDLAHALEMEVVAEGVETPAALALLSVMGCDMAQGYYISRPLALDALIVFLREARHRDLVAAARSPAERLAALRSRR